MKKLSFLLLCLLALAGFSARADEVDDLNRDVEGLRQNMEQVHRALQERVGSLSVDQAHIEQARRKLMLLASDQQFLKALGDLWNSPERNTLLVAELIFAVFMYFFRAWRQAKARNWFTRTLASFFLTMFWWVGVLLVLPGIILGAPFRQVVSTLWRVLNL